MSPPLPRVPDLAASQRWLQRAILAPGGSIDGVGLPDAGDMLASSDGLSAQQRLDIYRRGYRLRLLEAMRELQPGLRALLGPELFDDFVLEYLDACPSRSRSLADVGRRLAGYLAAQRPDRAEPLPGARHGSASSSTWPATSERLPRCTTARALKA